jgi:hypothetical protein
VTVRIQGNIKVKVRGTNGSFDDPYTYENATLELVGSFVIITPTPITKGLEAWPAETIVYPEREIAVVRIDPGRPAGFGEEADE